MNPGLKENGGIFMHTQGWGVMAEAMMGHGDRAYEYLRAYLPAACNDKAEIREIEPYVLCQSTHSKYSPKQGASRIPWLSGSATWTYYAITQYILGVRPEYGGLTLDPCIPTTWDRLKIRRRFRGKNLQIIIRNPNGNQRGVASMLLNGERVNGNYIAGDMLKEENELEVIMK
jgi:cellobiose phosphorylase